MIVAIPNNENMINQHFGRSISFIIATIDNKEIKDIKEVSTADFTHQHGALAKMLVSNNVKVAIVGGIGKGASGEYKSILNELINGTLESKDIVCNHNGEHHHHH